MVTVICPIYNEENFISVCIDSIIAQDYPKEDLEILFVDGMSTDNTREIIAGYQKKYPFIHLLDNPGKIVSVGMNIGIKASKGEIIIRLDGHALYPQDYFSRIVEWHRKLPDAWNVGGVFDTRAFNSNPVSEAISKVMSDRFGVGNSTARIGTDKDCLRSDTVPFGAYKSFVFEKIGAYNEKLVRCQDLELNKRVSRAGGSVYMVPAIHCTYYPRGNYKDFYRNRYLTGYWVIKTCFITKTIKNFRLRHYIPMLFVLALTLPLVLGFIWWPFFLISASVAVLYFATMLTRSIMIVDEKTTVWSLFKAFCCIHFSYGLGSILALFSA